METDHPRKAHLFLGALLLSVGSLIRHPQRFRWLALVRQLELVGVSALPIIGLMSFLIGIVIAQQGAVQLAQFGAETLTVNLVGRITLRELGVLMTAIMVAGRSGSAFAAQIGTMRLTEEVDAMQTIGISPMEAQNKCSFRFGEIRGRVKELEVEYKVYLLGNGLYN